jgi:hypothetical protein
MTKINSIKNEMLWWDSLTHGGLLIAPARLGELDKDTIELPSNYYVDQLRSLIARAEVGDETVYNKILDVVFEDILGRKTIGHWLKGPALSNEWTVTSITGLNIKPKRVWQSEDKRSTLPIFVDTDINRIGIGKGINFHARSVEWLRSKKLNLGILFNGKEIRLVYAGLDFDAWASWDLTTWFQAGDIGPQFEALIRVLTLENFVPENSSDNSRLLRLIKDSRKGQAELSKILGEQVRGAVELFIREFKELADDTLIKNHNVDNQSVYISSTRIIMRIITALFAESRELLPVSSPVYESSYGVRGLRRLLEKRSTSGASRLKETHYAWPRLQALFQLLYYGSPHSDLTAPQYNGDLYRPGDAKSADVNSRALYIIESSTEGPSDWAIAEILRLLTSVKTTINQRGGKVTRPVPIDFSDLSSEYIGILYEGLLDYELHRAPVDTPVLFLNIGNQPGLQLSRLEEMSDNQLKELFKNLKKKDKSEEESDDESDDEVDEDSQDVPDVDEAEDVDLSEESLEDARRLALNKAIEFTKRAAIVAGLAKKPRANKPEDLESLNKIAKGLIAKQPIMPNEWYLIRWGGTRKGGGSYYTRPQLSVPTVLRTLEPLCYNIAGETKIIKKPEEILSLKVCDPAMWSGSFLIGAIRYLSDILKVSLYFHKRIEEKRGKTEVRIISTGIPEDDIIEQIDLPSADEKFAPILINILKRRIVENCIYGVDIDSMAVELSKLALWIETMDKKLPFEFLDHRLKCGNALIGCNLVDFLHYPIEAWSRDLGDEKHKNGVHFKESQFATIKKQIYESKVKPEISRWISNLEQTSMEFENVEDLKSSIKEVLKVYRKLAKLGIADTEKKRQLYIVTQQEPKFQRLKQIFDTWCAIWFIEPFNIDKTPTPLEYPSKNPEVLKLVDSIAKNPITRFFHWELEFPEVFATAEGIVGRGFDAILGNPPWETLKPLSKEFFSNLDPLYRGLGKQAAISTQKYLFREEKNEKEWLLYNSVFAAQSNWFSYCSSPSGNRKDKPVSLGRGKEGLGARQIWERKIKKDEASLYFRHQYTYQGKGENNTYRLFLESSFRLLKPNGYLGYIVPAGIYSDKGSSELRSLFLKNADWQWLFSFENKMGIFDIHKSFKFCPIIIQKGKTTEIIKSAFMRHDLDDWQNAEKHVINIPADRISNFSPHNLAILELQSDKDVEVLSNIYRAATYLNGESNDWDLSYAREFDMTNDSKLFQSKDKLLEQGFKDVGLGVYSNSSGERMLPLYEGRMIGQFNFSQKEWLSGSGRTAKWKEQENWSKTISPHYYINYDDVLRINPKSFNLRVGFMDVTASTNTRTMIASLISFFPANNKVPVFNGPIEDIILAVGAFNSFVFDYCIRKRIAGITLNLHYLNESPLPAITIRKYSKQICDYICRLNLNSFIFSKVFVEGKIKVNPLNFAITRHERLRLRCILDAIYAYFYSISIEDFQHILKGCDYDAKEMANAYLDPKGFWRV